jgi:antitoxin component YwqK of YwqJK toxin-antitoxin module
MLSNTSRTLKRRLVIWIAGGVIALVATSAFLVWRSYLGRPGEVLRSRIVMRDGLAYDGPARRPFSGVVFEKFSNGTRQTAIEMRAGKVNGWSRGWFENGQLEVEEFFVDGVSQHTRRRWFENGQKRSETQIKDGQLSGSYVEWHDNGQKAVEMTLINGKPDGVVESWHRSGGLKSHAVLKLGNIVEQQFFPEFVAQSQPSGTQP